jgi:nitrite reductase/ring-hydroxylating ferredoxin subunit
LSSTDTPASPAIVAAEDDPWQKLAGIDAATSAFPASARIGRVPIFIIRTKHGFRGVERACPHLKATLVDASLMANDTMIRCSQHSYTFKLADGKGVNCPGYFLKVFEVKVEDGALFARAANSPISVVQPAAPVECSQ